MLSKVKVLDMSRVLAGPYCTMLLADLGARVYKIERPGCGDETRTWGPPFHNGESCYFLSVNRNKKSLAINFKKPEGSKVIQKLASKCDVLVENFLPGQLKPFGLDYASLRKRNPGLIYCSITGYGQKGILSQRPGYDVVVSSVGGLIGITGPKNGDPCRIGVALTDISTGLYAYSSILAALLSRITTGAGTHIDANLLSTQTAVLSHIAANWLNCGKDGSRWGTGHPSIVPYQSFVTSDNRHVVVGAGNNESFKILSEILNLPDLPVDDKFSTNASRVENRDELISILQKKFIEQTSDHWESVFANVDLPFGRINAISEGMQLASTHNPKSILNISNENDECVSVTGPAVSFSNPSFIRESHSFPPKLGEHTLSVLKDELSLSDAHLETLSKDGIISTLT